MYKLNVTLQFGGKQQSHGVSRSGLLERVRFVSQLMKTEFVFKPTFNIEENFRDVTASLIAKSSPDYHPLAPYR